MQSHISYKKNIFVFFSFGVSLNVWYKKKILDRELDHYKKLQKRKSPVKSADRTHVLQCNNRKQTRTQVFRFGIL